MVKPKIKNETDEQRFKRIATQRTIKVLNYLRLLGNCANKKHYSYSVSDVNKIFSAIEQELKRIKTQFKETKRGFTLE